MNRLILALTVCTSTLLACGGNCETKSCSDFGGSAAKTFVKCYYGTSPIETTISDSSGKQIYDCTDSETSTCTGATVDAENNYCAQ